MPPLTDMSRRHAARLAELTELGMSLARDLHAEAAAAETPELKAELSQAFHRVARTVRQSMALEARLAREDRREAMESAARSVTRRKAEVRARVRGMVWNEAEASDCAALIEDLDDRLSDAEHLPDFSADLDTHIARLRGELGLEPAIPAVRRRKSAEASGGPVEIKVTFVDPTEDLELAPGWPGAG